MENVHPGQIEQQIGKYRLIAELGRGGMANVYLSVVQGLAGFNKLVVIKLLKTDLASDPYFVEMFLNEAQLAARLNHPNVVQTNEVGAEGSRPFIAMEFLDGQPLNRILSRGYQSNKDALPLEFHLRILSDMLAGLHHAHELQDYDGTSLGVVHRDISPHNIFVTYDGQVKVVDFGIAKVLNTTTHTQTGMLKGKVQYMSPEQVRGEELDRRADLFVLGILLWEAVSRKRMWKGLSDVTILKRIVLGEIPSLSEANPDVDPELLRITQKALSLPLEERYQTALELKSDLDTYLKKQGSTVDSSSLQDWIKEHFSEDRSKLQKIIETQLSKLRSIPTSELAAAQLPIVDFNTTIMTSSSFSAGATPSSHVSAPGPNSTSFTAGSSAQSISTPAPGSSFGKILGGIGVALVLALGATFLSRPTTVPATSTTVASAEPREVEVLFKAVPADAQLLWDGKPLPGNPFKGRFPLDGQVHHLVVRAPGFLERSQDVDLTMVSEITVQLEPEKVAEKILPPTEDKKEEKEDKNKPARVAPGGGYKARPEPPAPTTATPPVAPTVTNTELKIDPKKKGNSRTIDKDVPY